MVLPFRTLLGYTPLWSDPLYGPQKHGPKLPLVPLPPSQVSPRAHLELKAGSFFGTLLSDRDHSVTTVKELRPRGLALGLGGPSCSGSNFAARFSWETINIGTVTVSRRVKV